MGKMSAAVRSLRVALGLAGAVAIHATPLPAQQSAFHGTATVQLIALSNDDFYRDREVLAVRYRPRLVGSVYGHVGGTLIAENGLFPSKSGASLRHWAAGVEVEPVRGRTTWILGLSHGRIVEQRSDERAHALLPDVTYYAFFAGMTGLRVAGLRGPLGPQLELTLESVWWTPQSVSLGTNTALLRMRTRPLSCLFRIKTHAQDQAAWRFLNLTCALQPFELEPWRRGPVGRRLRWLQLEAGQRPVLSYTENRDVGLRYVAVGAAFTLGGQSR
jgi:hypothetical protein